MNDDVVHRAKHGVASGDAVDVIVRQRAEERTPPPAPRSTVQLEVLFEDETLLVVNKPHQLLSVATDRLEVDTLHSRCVEYLKDATLGHGASSASPRPGHIRRHGVRQAPTSQTGSSTAIPRPRGASNLPCPGRAHPTAAGTVNSWLMEDKHLNVKAVNKSHPQGKKAITHYHTLNSSSKPPWLNFPSKPADAIKFGWPCNTSAHRWWAMSDTGPLPIRTGA